MKLCYLFTDGIYVRVQVGELLRALQALATLLPVPLRHALLLLPTTPPCAPAPSPDTDLDHEGASIACSDTPTHPSPPPFPPTAPTTVLMVWGSTVMVASNLVCITGHSVSYYMAGLVLLGLGWAWVYVSASSLVAGV
jgi:hypothetical protein